MVVRFGAADLRVGLAQKDSATGAVTPVIPGTAASMDQELMARVWPNVFVAPSNPTVHICALPRALCDGRDGNGFIINFPGRGYRFVASVAIIGPRCGESMICLINDTVLFYYRFAIGLQ